MAVLPYQPNLTTERGRHLHWCKERAFEYLDRGDIAGGVASFVSDMGKNNETANHPALPMIMFQRYEHEIKRFIEGFH